MQHPFVSDLDSKSLEDLQKTVTDLNGKLNFAFRTGNTPLITQVQMVIESYQAEIAARLDALYKKQNVQNSINISSKG